MTNGSLHRSLLEGIYALGEHLCEALESGAVDTVVALIDQRGALVERLTALEAAPWGAEHGKEHAVLFKQQHSAILAAAAAQEQRLVAAQGLLKQKQEAQTRYGDRSARRRFLHKDLCG